jgi:hypothetical protein
MNFQFNKLPEPIKEIVQVMETDEEKQMALYASLAIAGSLMPLVHINYGGKQNYPALMLLISYPPASGKGKLSSLLLLLRRIMDEQLELKNKALRNYNAEKIAAERKLKKGEPAEIPERPKTPILVIPANTTSSKLTEQLAENSGKMMMLLFETETDAITNMMTSKYGIDNSMILRKVYHHEAISQMRKTNDEHLEVATPKMVIVLTGTPSQIPRLFHSNQDGLISRFLIVTGNAPLVWKSVQPCDSCKTVEEQFAGIGDTFYSIYQFFKNRKVEVKLTPIQWAALDAKGANWITLCESEGGEYAVSLAKRHANMIARMATIFTMLRYYHAKSSSAIEFCSDEDYQLAEFLGEQSLACSLELFKSLPGEQVTGGESLEEFYRVLPNSFSKKELAPLIKTLGKSLRTIERMLKRLVEQKRVELIKPGQYKKVSVAELT